VAENGRLPAGDLAKTVVGVTIRKDLVKQTDQLALAFYREFKRPMKATDGYRSYEQQVDVKRRKGAYAATPGKSNHGWGRAIDWASDINVDRSEEHRWMEKNGPKFGWTNPEWARNATTADGQYEPWHWEAERKSVNAPYVGLPGKDEVGFGQRGAKVKQVQELLKDYGFKRLVVDSDFGMTTGDAVVRFQEDRGLVQDGIVGPKTLAALKGGKVAKPLPAPKPKPKPEPKEPTLRRGDKGAEVKRLQQGLTRVFPTYATLAADGDFGWKTERAVKRFQVRAGGLQADGVVGPRTRAALKKHGVEF
jgi:peptidoglycan hydrolase-like protein with peptidoglycan-binding domain